MLTAQKLDPVATEQMFLVSCVLQQVQVWVHSNVSPKYRLNLLGLNYISFYKHMINMMKRYLYIIVLCICMYCIDLDIIMSLDVSNLDHDWIMVREG